MRLMLWTRQIHIFLQNSVISYDFSIMNLMKKDNRDDDLINKCWSKHLTLHRIVQTNGKQPYRIDKLLRYLSRKYCIMGIESVIAMLMH